MPRITPFDRAILKALPGTVTHVTTELYGQGVDVSEASVRRALIKMEGMGLTTLAEHCWFGSGISR